MIKVFGFGQLCSSLEEPEHVVRYWLDNADLVQPQRDRAGHLRFVQRDFELLQEVKRLIRDEGYTLPGAEARIFKALSASIPGPRGGSVSPAELLEQCRQSRSLLQSALERIRSSRLQRQGQRNRNHGGKL